MLHLVGHIYIERILTMHGPQNIQLVFAFIPQCVLLFVVAVGLHSCTAI